MGSTTTNDEQCIEQCSEEIRALCSEAYFFILAARIKFPELDFPGGLMDALDNVASGYPLDSED